MPTQVARDMCHIHVNTGVPLGTGDVMQPECHGHGCSDTLIASHLLCQEVHLCSHVYDTSGWLSMTMMSPVVCICSLASSALPSHKYICNVVLHSTTGCTASGLLGVFVHASAPQFKNSKHALGCSRRHSTLLHKSASQQDC